MLSPSLKFYTVSTVLFRKYLGENFAVTNFMSRFYMFDPTRATVELANVNTGHALGIGIISCFFPNLTMIYPAGTIFFSGHPYNTNSLGALKFMLFFKRLHMNLLNVVILLTLKVVFGDHPTRLKTI